MAPQHVHKVTTTPQDGGELVDRLTEREEVPKGSRHQEECDCGQVEEEKSDSLGFAIQPQAKLT